MAGLQDSHFTLEILIFAGVVILVSVSNSNSGAQKSCLIELSSSDCLLKHGRLKAHLFYYNLNNNKRFEVYYNYNLIIFIYIKKEDDV